MADVIKAPWRILDLKSVSGFDLVLKVKVHGFVLLESLLCESCGTSVNSDKVRVLSWLGPREPISSVCMWSDTLILNINVGYFVTAPAYSDVFFCHFPRTDLSIHSDNVKGPPWRRWYFVLDAAVCLTSDNRKQYSWPWVKTGRLNLTVRWKVTTDSSQFMPFLFKDTLGYKYLCIDFSCPCSWCRECAGCLLGDFSRTRKHLSLLVYLLHRKLPFGK